MPAQEYSAIDTSVLARQGRSEASVEALDQFAMAWGVHADVADPVARTILAVATLLRTPPEAPRMMSGEGIRNDGARVYAELGINSASKEGLGRIQRLEALDVLDAIRDGSLVVLYSSTSQQCQNELAPPFPVAPVTKSRSETRGLVASLRHPLQAAMSTFRYFRDGLFKQPA